MGNFIHNTCMIMRVPITIFDRHIHLSQIHAEQLFGKGYNFKIKKKCIQPREYITQETLIFKGDNGQIENIQIILPFRKNTQVELFDSDKEILGLDIPEKFSNEFEGTSKGTLIGPIGSVYLKQGVIIARPHIHLSVAQSEDFGFKNNQIVSVETHGTKIYKFENVKIRAKDYFEFDFHINKEQAKLAGVQNGDRGEIIVN